jgi:hypothetical protein
MATVLSGASDTTSSAPGAETYKVYVVRSCSDSFILDKYACCVYTLQVSSTLQ